MVVRLGLIGFVKQCCIAILVVGWVLPPAGRAETGVFECRGDPLPTAAAARILYDVQTAYGSVSSLEATFVQDSYLAALDVSERSSGTMIYERPGRMRWEYTAPEPQSFVVRDGTVWFYQPRERQVLIDEFRDVLISDIPVSFLMGLGQLTKDFSVLRACVSGGSTVLELKPSGAEGGEQLQGFILVVDEKRLPLGARVTDVGGNTTAIRLADRKLNRTIPADSFQVTIPPGTDVNDQRLKKGER